MMVNLLLVSHSKKLAESAADMALQMIASDTVKIVTAAGIGEDSQEFGTNAVEIAEALQSVYTAAGVLVLMDLGSAVLSTQMALELIPPEMKDNTRVCPAPFVEGAVVAAAQASTGAGLDDVYREAMRAADPKVEQIGGAGEIVPEYKSSDSPVELEDGIILTVTNEHGLHARPGVRFVQAASEFDAEIMVKNLTTDKGPSSAKSLTAVTFLGVNQGHQIKITAEGRQKDEALKALAELVRSNFK